MTRQRSVGSRLYRLLRRPAVWRLSAVSLLAGIALSVMANPGSVLDPVAKQVGISGGEAGIMLVVFGVFAGIARWVATPAAKDVVAEHVEKLHKEQDSRHEALVAGLAAINVSVVALSGHLDAKFAGLPCQKASSDCKHAVYRGDKGGSRGDSSANR